MEEIWLPVKDFLFLSLFLLIAIILKNKIRFFKRFLIPTAIIGGFIGLIYRSVLEFTTDAASLTVIKLNPDFLGNLVYHLMAIGFISLALKERTVALKDDKKDNVNTGFAITSAYLLQGILGFALSLLLAYTILPELFPPFGLLLPLGFAQGPGQAYSIGTSWEALGFTNGGNIGLSIATIGYLWAIIPGIPLLNFLVRRKERLSLTGLEKDIKIFHEEGSALDEKHTENIPRKIFIDSLSVQIVLIGIVYIITYFLLKGITLALGPLGDYGQTVSQLLWGFHFVIATMVAILVRMVLNVLKRKDWLHINYPDNYTLQRISSASFDYMIVAAITAISIITFKENWIAIVIITTAGGILTMLYTILLCRRIYNSFIIEHIVALYGMWTGTISTGIALLREIDPESRSNAAENLVLGSAVALPLGVPLMFILGLAINGYRVKNPMLYFYTLIIFTAFFTVLLLIMVIKRKNKASV
ncbi:MAG: sodium:glutamate symporter [Actinobacteria bacterium]|nr:sodium:glutamate symporter [Actinomycetota bacterium]